MEIPRWAVFIFGYFAVQLEQIFGWWVLGMVIGSAVSVFAKDYLPASIQSFYRLERQQAIVLFGSDRHNKSSQSL